MRARTLLVSTVWALAACGGDGGESALDRYQQAVARANQMEASARTLGTPSPCQQSQQCALLTFLQPTACPMQTFHAYSTISATAVAAAAAASQQVMLAEQAIALHPGPPQPCPLIAVLPPPPPVCVANLCQ